MNITVQANRCFKEVDLSRKRYGLYTDKVQADLDTTLNIQIDYGEDNEK